MVNETYSNLELRPPPAAGDGVEEPEHVKQLEGRARLVQPGDLAEAIARSVGEPGVSGDGRIVGRDPVRHRHDGAGDVQRRDGRVGLRPERRTAGSICDRQRERQPAVGERAAAANQSQSSGAHGLVAGATSANASNAWGAPPG